MFSVQLKAEVVGLIPARGNIHGSLLSVLPQWAAEHSVEMLLANSEAHIKPDRTGVIQAHSVCFITSQWPHMVGYPSVSRVLFFHPLVTMVTASWMPFVWVAWWQILTVAKLLLMWFVNLLWGCQNQTAREANKVIKVKGLVESAL